MAPGVGMGETLKILQTRWMEADFPGDPATLARLLDETLARRD